MLSEFDSFFFQNDTMTDGIEAVTRAALSLALDAAGLRQQAMATNIAHASATGYAPRRVSFEAQLAGARRSLQESGMVDPSTLVDVRPRIETGPNGHGVRSRVELDVEAAAMARNAVHYQALAKGLSSHYAILSMAAGDGRR